MKIARNSRTLNSELELGVYAQPKNKDELKEIIKNYVSKVGAKGVIDLNWIDTSQITDMSYLFRDSDLNFDVSKWNVSNVRFMSSMFEGCKNFNSDLSKWDVSNVEDMMSMFEECGNFNSDLSKWNVRNVENMESMFARCETFNSDLSKWDVSKVRYMTCMFLQCGNFNSDLSKWDVSNVEDMESMFAGCESLKVIPSWYKEYKLI